MRKVLILVPLVVLLLFSTSFAATTYVVDNAHTQIHFSVTHLMFFKVRGTFHDFNGTINIDPDGRTLTSARTTIDAKSINTRDEKRDTHLRSDDFFDVANHPVITFVSKSVAGSGENIEVVGDLTIRGVTREITLKGSFVGPMVDHQGNDRAGFVATGMVNRKDFGLNWNRALETGGVVVGDNVEIGLEVAAVRRK